MVPRPAVTMQACPRGSFSQHRLPVLWRPNACHCLPGSVEVLYMRSSFTVHQDFAMNAFALLLLERQCLIYFIRNRLTPGPGLKKLYLYTFRQLRCCRQCNHLKTVSSRTHPNQNHALVARIANGLLSNNSHGCSMAAHQEIRIRLTQNRH